MEYLLFSSGFIVQILYEEEYKFLFFPPLPQKFWYFTNSYKLISNVASFWYKLVILEDIYR